MAQQALSVSDVILLLSSLTDDIPFKGRTLDEATGFDHRPRLVKCPDCDLNGFVSADCATCRGRGELSAPVDRDPYDTGVGIAWAGVQEQRRRDNERRLDSQLRGLPDRAELPDLLRAIDRKRDEEEPLETSLLRAVRLRDRGDYRYVEQALGELQSWAKMLVFDVYVGVVPEAGAERRERLGEEDRDRLDRVVAWLERRTLALIRGENMRRRGLGLATREETLRVPAHIRAGERERLRALEEAKRAKGRWSSAPHARGVRNREVRRLRAEGLSLRQIGRRLGLSKSTVQKIVEAGEEQAA